MELVRTGATDSPVMPLAESISIAETLDAARLRIGLCYPFEDSRRKEVVRTVPVAGTAGGTS